MPIGWLQQCGKTHTTRYSLRVFELLSITVTNRGRSNRRGKTVCLPVHHAGEGMWGSQLQENMAKGTPIRVDRKWD